MIASESLTREGAPNKHLEGEASMVTVEADSDAKRLIGRRFIDVSVQSGIRFGLSRSFLVRMTSS